MMLFVFKKQKPCPSSLTQKCNREVCSFSKGAIIIPTPLFLNIFWSNINNIMGNCNNLKMQDEHVKLFLAHTLDKHPALTYQAV